MIPELIVVRHGETDWNAVGRLQGQTDIPLNARGRDQADAVGRTLAKLIPDPAAVDFVASPLLRASDTMRSLRRRLGLGPDGFRTDPRLMELSFGAWEGLTWPEIAVRDPDGLRAREADPWDYRPPGGESYADLAERVGAALAEAARPAVLVAHGGVSRVLLGSLGGVARQALPDLRIHQGRALIFGDGRWRWS